MITRNIKYAQRSERNRLDVLHFDGCAGLPVIFFIHGGSWMSGSKEMYTRLGENFLPEGFVSVIISYRLFPETDVYGMTEDCCDAFRWCAAHIDEYGGNKERIFLVGHSAGGHLAAVTGLSQHEPRKNVKGCVMIDAFGLSAHYFLTTHGALVPGFFSGIFGTQSEKWPLAAPDKLLKADLPPFLVLSGGATYPFLIFDNENFVSLLKKGGNPCTHRVIPGKTHMQMVYEYENSRSLTFRETVAWLREAEG
jgi:acetyl esterase/lipase